MTEDTNYFTPTRTLPIKREEITLFYDLGMSRRHKRPLWQSSNKLDSFIKSTQGDELP
jgi:hypothetical protein